MLHERDRAGYNLALYGDFDISRRAELRDAFAIVPGSGHLELDLGDVGYLDSTFLNQLAILRRRREVDASITIRHASAQIRRLFMLVGYDSIFRIV